MARNKEEEWKKEWSDNHREETERQEQEARRTSYATLTNKMHKTEDEEQQANITKTTQSNLRATLATKEHPEPYTGTSAPTSITRSKLFSPGITDTKFGFPDSRVQNLQPGTNHRMTKHRETKTYRSPEATTEVSQVSALRKGRLLT